MSISEAAQLVLQASSMAQGGEIFVLDMGKPVKIFDLAIRMIKLKGFSVKDADSSKGDIEIMLTGLKPGEKLHEELLGQWRCCWYRASENFASAGNVFALGLTSPMG